MSNSGAAFIYFDGDDVGARIELALLDADLELAAIVSKGVKSAVELLANALVDSGTGSIIFAAGDEVLARLSTTPTSSWVEELRSIYRTVAGGTVSCGVGADSREAAQNLRRAKLLGKNRSVGVDGV